jgi:hypothetical protein
LVVYCTRKLLPAIEPAFAEAATRTASPRGSSAKKSWSRTGLPVSVSLLPTPARRRIWFSVNFIVVGFLVTVYPERTCRGYMRLHEVA